MTGSAASARACARTVSSSSANGTASLIRPTSAASAPDSGLPVSAYSFAFVRPSRYSHMPLRYAPHMRE